MTSNNAINMQFTKSSILAMVAMLTALASALPAGTLRMLADKRATGSSFKLHTISPRLAIDLYAADNSPVTRKDVGTNACKDGDDGVRPAGVTGLACIF